jgi:methyl-accepting chemotaxis protein
MTNRKLKDIAEGEGDLTMNLPSDTKEELGTLASWFHKFTGKNRTKASTGKQNADVTADSSVKLTSASIHASQEIESISRNLNTITDGLENNTEIFEVAAASVKELAGGAVMESEEAKTSYTVLDTAENGTKTLKEMVEVMENPQQSYGYMFDTMESLNESSDQTSKFVEEISKIAEEASLLALNAVIEAFGAEDTINSFAILAKEFSYLSQNNIPSAEVITERIEPVEDNVDTAEDSTVKPEPELARVEKDSTVNLEPELVRIEKDSTVKPEPELVCVEKDSTVKPGPELVRVENDDVADSGYQNILDSIDEMVKTILDICEAAKIQTVVDEISQTMDGISSSTKKVSSSTKEVSSSTQEVSSSTKEASSSTKEVSSSTKEASSSTKEASSSTKKTSSPTKEVSSSTKEVSSSTKKASSPTKEVSSSTKKVSSSTHEVTASTQKISATAQEISVTAQESAVSSESINSSGTNQISTFEDINISIMDLSKTHESKRSKRPVISRKKIFKK